MTRSVPIWEGATDDAKEILRTARRGRARVNLTVDYFRARTVVDPVTGCWIWQGCIAATGYGGMTRRHTGSQLAHRNSWVVANGRPIGPQMNICHRCDVRACVNPEHLFLGTRSDNMVDCRQKGRLRVPGLKGERSPLAKLTEKDVVAIRGSTKSANSLAKEYGVSKRAIQRVVQRRSWRHVP